MTRLNFFRGAVALLGVALFGSVASAQVNPYGRLGGGAGAGPGVLGRPGLGLGIPAGQILNPIGSTNPYSAGNSTPAGNLGTGAYWANPLAGLQADPYGGYLRGSADVISAQSGFMRARQEAAILREQARREKLDTYRRTFDQWKYIRENTPSPEQIRKEFQVEQVKRALNNPPATEVLSGKSLNDLLNAFDPTVVKSATVNVPIDQDALKSVNTTKDGGNTGNVGLLRDSGKLSYPQAIKDLGTARPELQDNLDKLSKLSALAYNQAVNGKVEGTVTKEMAALTRSLNEELTRKVGETDFVDYRDAKAFLKGLDDAIVGLKDTDAGKLLGTGVARGKTAQDVVTNMLNNGYRFAAANPGDEAAYRMLHNKLASYYNALQQAQAAAP